MGIYDREYYRGETRGAGLFSTAPVCRAIILVNVAVFVLEHLRIIDRATFEGLFAAHSDAIFHRGHVWQLLTAPFLHADALHLIVNMYLLWLCGHELEAMYGPRDFLAFYLSAAVVSTFAWAACNALGMHHYPMVGASGAVYAVAALFALFYPRREILLMFVIPVEVWLLFSLYVAYDVFQMISGRETGVAVAAHVSGAAYGYLFKRFDFRWSRLPIGRGRRPKLRIVSADPPREKPVPRPAASGPTWSPGPASASKPAASTAAVVPEEQLDARLDDVLAKIAREGRGGLTDEDNRVLQEASRPRPEPPERPAVTDRGVVVRDAVVGDLERIVAFNARLASETENKTLDPAVLERGVRSALADATRLRYWVAESAATGEMVGQSAVSREWSDWRDGWLWWLQSVYVRPDARGLGVFRSLYAHIRSTARETGDVVGLRLYVERANDPARSVYSALGMTDGGYLVYEEVWPDRPRG